MVEARDTDALSSGARGLAIRIGPRDEQALGRHGRVWGDRYHTRALTTPREVRHGLVYVLMNVKKHRPSWRGLDPCSSARWFDGFRDRRKPGPRPDRIHLRCNRRAPGWLPMAGAGTGW